MIVSNDVMAYVFGKICGKTPLIKLSPNKTWEGFIGGGLATIVLGAFLSHFMCGYQYFVCPVNNSIWLEITECQPSPLFVLTEYRILPDELIRALEMFYIIKIPTKVHIYPFMLHSLALSLFSSVLGPFGGFFASGFKRAFKVKDFSDVIPGHGGMVDRFDCQFLMAAFTNVYISSFIRGPSYSQLLGQILLLPSDLQLKIYENLRKRLVDEGQIKTPEGCLT